MSSQEGSREATLFPTSGSFFPSRVTLPALIEQSYGYRLIEQSYGYRTLSDASHLIK